MTPIPSQVLSLPHQLGSAPGEGSSPALAPSTVPASSLEMAFDDVFRVLSENTRADQDASPRNSAAPNQAIPDESESEAAADDSDSAEFDPVGDEVEAPIRTASDIDHAAPEIAGAEVNHRRGEVVGSEPESPQDSTAPSPVAAPIELAVYSVPSDSDALVIPQFIQELEPVIPARAERSGTGQIDETMPRSTASSDLDSPARLHPISLARGATPLTQETLTQASTSASRVAQAIPARPPQIVDSDLAVTAQATRPIPARPQGDHTLVTAEDSVPRPSSARPDRAQPTSGVFSEQSGRGPVIQIPTSSDGSPAATLSTRGAEVRTQAVPLPAPVPTAPSPDGDLASSQEQPRGGSSAAAHLANAPTASGLRRPTSGPYRAELPATQLNDAESRQPITGDGRVAMQTVQSLSVQPSPTPQTHSARPLGALSLSDAAAPLPDSRFADDPDAVHPATTRVPRGAATSANMAQPGPIQIAQPQGRPTQSVAQGGSDLPLSDTDDLAGLFADAIRDPRGGIAMPTAVSTASAPEVARHVAQQIAAALPRQGGQAVELRLNPEELGRVRLSMVPGDGSLSVTILAERGDTLDLMRRHIAHLEAEFRELGYSDIQFSFGTSGQGNNGKSPASEQPEYRLDLAAETIAQGAAPISGSAPLNHSGSDSLDLRI